jgi:hypothetical protein
MSRPVTKPAVSIIAFNFIKRGDSNHLPVFYDKLVFGIIGAQSE